MKDWYSIERKKVDKAVRKVEEGREGKRGTSLKV